MNRPFHQLGKMIREQSDDAERAQAVISGAKERFIEVAQERQLARGGGWFAPGRLVAVFAVVAALAGAWGVSQLSGESDRPLSVTLEERSVALVGSWVHAGEETKQLSFSDGTKLSLHPETDLRVRETTPSGAWIELGRGRTLAQVEPRKGATWNFRAGPFNVKVTGTEFDLAWDPDEQVLELALHHGSVILSGPSVKGQKAVHKGEFVRVRLEPPEPESAVEAEPPAPEEPDEADELTPPETSEPRPGVVSPGQGWRKELKEGGPQDAVTAIEKAGSKSVLGSASSQELWQIARVARLGGRPQLAKGALLALRNKHGTRGQTSYLLGKVHADQLGATSEAIKWFETYLKETPSGSLAEQAMGRVAELQAGTRAGKRAARRYLERYPGGSYADFCQSQLR